MNKKLVFDFLKDRLSMTVIFFSNSFLIALFYHITTHSSIEILYPASISIFIYLILMLVEWFKYYGFNKKLMLHGDDIYYDFEPATREQRNISSALGAIHKKHEQRIFQLELENRNQNHFTSQWIHNMKTPISVIDIILQRASSEKTFSQETLDSIKEENQKLLNSLEQVLNLIRLGNFSKDYVPESTDLVASVKKVINSRKNQFIYNRVYPKLQAPPHPIYVLSDAKWNETIIDQLVSNAIKYSSAEKNVYFTIEQKDNGVFLKIKDQGIGIPEHDIKRIFEPFFTGDNGRAYKNATGIGLYICATIAEKLGQGISVKSRVNKGTEVTVTYKCPPSPLPNTL